ncbi:MAG: tetratricopeptide repeat protein [Bacteroidota bacterium]
MSSTKFGNDESSDQLLLEKKLSQMPNDAKKVDVYLEMARNLYGHSPDEALQYALEGQRLAERLDYIDALGELIHTIGIIWWYKSAFDKSVSHHNKALEIFRIVKNKKGIGSAYTGIGNVHARKGDFNKALDYYHKALAIHKSHAFQEGIAGSYNNIGIIYKNKGDYSKALDCYLKSLRLKEIVGDKLGIANSYTNIGIVFYYLKEYKKALEYHKKALLINQKMGDKKKLADTQSNIGIAYSEMSQFKKALRFLNNSIEIKKEIGDKIGMTHCYRETGMINLKQKNYEEALNHFRTGLQLSEEIGARTGIGYFFNRIGELYYLQNQPEKAINYLNDALRINKQAGVKDDLKDTYKLLSEASALSGNYAEAYQYQSTFIDLKDDLLDEEKNRIIQEMQTKYENEKKDLEIEKLHIEAKFLHHTNKELEQFATKAAHDLREPLRMMSNFSGLLVRRYQDVLDDNGMEFLKIIQSAAKRMSSLLQSMLRYAQTGNEKEGMIFIGLEEILSEVEANLQLAIQETETRIMYYDLPVVETSKNAMVQLFQNLLSNAIKFKQHDRTPRIQVICKESNTEFTIQVKDNGIGIAEEQLERIFGWATRAHDDSEGFGIGLATCKRIVESRGGKIWLESVLGEGTSVFFTIPKLIDTSINPTSRL